MGKKRSRAKQVSAGITHSNPTLPSKALRREYRGLNGKSTKPLEALMRGKNVVLTIENPNKNETNKRFIKVPSTEYWKSGFRTK